MQNKVDFGKLFEKVLLEKGAFELQVGYLDINIHHLFIFFYCFFFFLNEGKKVKVEEELIYVWFWEFDIFFVHPMSKFLGKDSLLILTCKVIF